MNLASRTGFFLLAVVVADVSRAQSQYMRDASFPAADLAFQNVSSLTVAPDGQSIYLLQRAPPNVMVLNPAGQLLRQWSTDALYYPHSLRVQRLPTGEQHIWITDMAPPVVAQLYGHCVKEFSEAGVLLGAIGACGEHTRGSGLDPLQFDKVTDIAFGSDGFMWISDGDLDGLNNRVLQLDAQRKVAQVWSAPGNRPGGGPREFNLPHMLDIDACDRVFVADTLNHRIQVISAAGAFVQQLQCFGTDGVYGMRVANVGGAARLFATSGPTTAGRSGTVRAFELAKTCSAPKPLPGDCATAAQWTIALPLGTAAAMLHTIDVGEDGAVYIATLGGNLPPQKWVPANSPR